MVPVPHHVTFVEADLDHLPADALDHGCGDDQRASLGCGAGTGRSGCCRTCRSSPTLRSNTRARLLVSMMRIETSSLRPGHVSTGRGLDWSCTDEPMQD